MKVGIINSNLVEKSNLTASLENDRFFDLIFSISELRQIRTIRQTPEIILLDLSFPMSETLYNISKIKHRFPESKIIILTTIVNINVTFQVFDKGVYGYIVKDDDLNVLKKFIKSVEFGGRPISPQIVAHVFESNFKTCLKELCADLTRTEIDVINQLKLGFSIKIISSIMNVSTNTINFHLKNIYKKMKVNSRSELLLLTFRTEVNYSFI